MTKHTPGQIESLWTAEEHAADKIKHEAIALAQSDPKRTILAWNCHEELVEALKGALFALGECSVGKEKLSELFPVKVAAARAALSKVGNGGGQ